MKRPASIVVVVAGLALVAAACGSSGGNASSDTSTKGTSASTAAPSTSTSATVATAMDPKLGTLLVGPNGHTLYYFEKDQGTTSACKGSCAELWPALTVSGTPQAGAGIDPQLLGVAHNQVTYAGHLLYYFAPDKAPGDTDGLGIPDWYAISPAGKEVSASEGPSADRAPSSTSSSSSSSGY